MMICAINQPTYLPWIGYFDLIDQADIFVYYDDIKITRSYWDVRNKIKSRDGSLFITVPVRRDKSHMETLFTNAEIDYEKKWGPKQLKTISMNYSRLPYFEEVYSFLSDIFNKKYTFLGDLNIDFIESIARGIGIETTTYRSSELGDLHGKSDIRLVSICKRLQVDAYLSPFGAIDYIEKESPGGALVKNGIDLYYQNYNHPKYAQLFGVFVSHMSILDLLLNYGFGRSLEIIRSGRLDNMHYKNLKTEKHLLS